MRLCVEVYQLTAAFPDAEKFGLTNQLRRAAVSIPSNIAEGYGRMTKGEYKQFLGMARGSTFELQTQLKISADLKFGDDRLRQTALATSDEISKMLYAILKKLNA